MINKDLIRDEEDGIKRVRYCQANVAKLNIWELIYLKFAQWNFTSRIKESLLENIATILEGLFGLFCLLVNLFCLVFLPITMPIASYIEIKKAKKAVEKAKQYQK